MPGSTIAFFSCILLCLVAGINCVQGVEGTEAPTASNLTVVIISDTSGTDSEPASKGDRQSSVLVAQANWTACPDEDFRSYSLYRSVSAELVKDTTEASLIYSVTDVDSIVFSDSTITWNIDFYYALLTQDFQDYSTWSNVETISTHHESYPPCSLTVSSVTPENFSLIWSEYEGNDFLYYILYRDVQPGIETYPSTAELVLITENQNCTSFTDCCTILGRDVYYALNVDVQSMPSIWSNEVSVYNEPVPLTVTGSLAGLSEPSCVSFVDDETICLSESATDGSFHLVSVNGPESIAEFSPTGTPVCVEPSDAGSCIYAATSQPDRLLILDGTDLAVLESLDLPGQPAGLSVDPYGEYIYCSLYDKDELLVIRTSDLQTEALVQLDAYPRGICTTPEGDYICVACTGNSSINIVDRSNWTVKKSLTIGPYPMDLVTTADGLLLLVTCWGDSRIYLITTYSWFITGWIDTPYKPAGLSMHPEGYLYTACEYADSICVICPSSERILATTSTDDGCWDVSVSPDGSFACAVNRSAGTLSLIGFQQR